jgi:TolA-binding protein
MNFKASVRNLLSSLLPASLLIAAIFYGCGGSSESEKSGQMTPTATDIMQHQMDSIKMDNQSLKSSLMDMDKVTGENRSLKAHNAELETQIADLKEKLTPPKPVDTVAAEQAPPKSTVSGGQSTYFEALSLFRKKNYGDALAKFQAVSDDPNSKKIADHSLYWSGECLYALKEYDDAIGAFEKVLKFEWSSKKDGSQMMIGNCYLAEGNKARAKESFEKLLSTYPASVYVKIAKKKLSKL